jgi:hypothetical protein
MPARGEMTEAMPLKTLPGYPWLPCPICKGIEGCDHTVWERAHRALPGLTFDDDYQTQ